MDQTDLVEIPGVFALSLLGFVVMLLAALAVVLFYVAHQRRTLSQRQTLAALREEQQKALLAATVTAEEAERSRLAADLHDEVGLLLTTSQLFIRQIPELPATAEHRQTSLDLIDRSLEQVRAISSNLSSENLQRYGLVPALQDLITTLRRGAAPTTITFRHGEPRRLPPHTERDIFRIAKELLTNGLKHARSNSIELYLDLSATNFTLEYRDDGIGTNLHTVSTTGLGLASIHSRALLLAAELELHSAPGTGFDCRLTGTTVPKANP
ncbi:MAG: ATP-binding protein [Bacteroidota bacterium]